MMTAILAAATLALAAVTPAAAGSAPDAPFKAIEGGDLNLADYRGGPVLVVNTASRCGFTYQYDGLQALYDAYRDQGLTVVAVPSDAFNQELASNEAVKDFCEVNYNLTVPMTEVTEVTGADAHPFYQWLKASHGFTPRWNFNKVLLDGEGRYVDAWGSSVRPMSGVITKKVEAALASGS